MLTSSWEENTTKMLTHTARSNAQWCDCFENSLVGSQKIKYRYSMTQQFLGVCPGK